MKQPPRSPLSVMNTASRVRITNSIKFSGQQLCKKKWWILTSRAKLGREQALWTLSELSLKASPYKRQCGFYRPHWLCSKGRAPQAECLYKQWQIVLYTVAMGSANLNELRKQYQPLQHPQNFTRGSKLCRQ